MKISNFIWLLHIAEKLDAKDNASPDEVEEIFFNRPRYRRIESGYRRDEDVYSAGGQTDDG
jgi:hypothetical protein